MGDMGDKETSVEEVVLCVLRGALYRLRDVKPEGRGELSRRYAVTITEMEKVVAYYKTFIVDDEGGTREN